FLSSDSHFTLIDETNYIAEAFSPEELRSLADRFTKIADDITVRESADQQKVEEETQPVKKPWWKLW
ncbi:MAG: hypothetical protein ACRC3B_11325, partial [Bacteroidia bacterium]